jgi:hypothetical protein
MKSNLSEADTLSEELLAELTDAAYRVALQYGLNGLRGPFLDLELTLWRELRGVLHRRRLHRSSVNATEGEVVFPLPTSEHDQKDPHEPGLCLIGEV